MLSPRFVIVSAVFALACTDAPVGDDSSGTTGESESGGTTDTDTDSSGSSAACSLYDQDCPVGEKCAWVWIDTGSTFQCVPVTGSLELGEACHHDGATLGTDDCDAQGTCYGPFSLTGGWEGVCTPHCAGSPTDPLCDAGQVCTLGNLSVCLSPCDPLVQDCPGETEICWYAPDANDFVCAVSSSLSGLAEACISPKDCVEGLTCVEGSTVFGCTEPGCCTPFCELDGPEPCPNAADGVECVDLMVGPEHANVGVCMLPP